jgi:hypothetical protein
LGYRVHGSWFRVDAEMEEHSWVLSLETGVRLIHVCITQLKAQGPISRVIEKEEAGVWMTHPRPKTGVFQIPGVIYKWGGV